MLKYLVHLTLLAAWLPLAALAAGGHNGSGHMSVKGAANSNAQSQPDSSRGLDRAAERRSDQGNAHRKSGRHKDRIVAKNNEGGLPLPPKPKLPPAPPKPPLP